jgi:hypothetical protein
VPLKALESVEILYFVIIESEVFGLDELLKVAVKDCVSCGFLLGIEYYLIGFRKGAAFFRPLNFFSAFFVD